MSFKRLIGSLLLYYDFSYYIDLSFLVDSIDLSAVLDQLQFFRSMHLSSLYCAAYDGFRLKGLCTQAVAETVLKFLLHLSLFVYVFKLH